MKRSIIFIKLLLPTFLLSSCAKPLISNLQKGSYAYTTTADDVLGVSVGLMPIQKPKEEEEKPKTFFDLRDSLPHVYLKLLSTKVTDPDKFIDFIHKHLSTLPKKPADKKALQIWKNNSWFQSIVQNIFKKYL